MNAKKPINLRMKASLNDKGQIYSFKVSLNPKEEAGNSAQFPIELKKGEMDKMIAMYSKNKDVINSKDITIDMSIQNKTLITHSVCKTEPIITTPPHLSFNDSKVALKNVITQMCKGLNVMVKEIA